MSKSILIKRRAWITLLGHGNYLEGVVGLYYSLKSVNSKYPLEVIVTSNTSSEVINVLNELKINYRIVEPLIPINSSLPNNICTWNKYYCLNYYDDYDQVWFVDADSVFIKNADYIFDKYKVPSVRFLSEGTMYAGELWGVAPNKKMFELFKSKLDSRITTWDQDTLIQLYGSKRLHNYSEPSDEIFHYSTCLSHVAKGWTIHNVHTPEEIKEYVETHHERRDYEPSDEDMKKVKVEADNMKETETKFFPEMIHEEDPGNPDD